MSGATTAATAARSAGATAGWWVLIVLDALLVLNGLALYLFVETSANGQTVGLLLATFGAVALMAALAGRAGEGRWPWRAGWVVAIGLAWTALHLTGRADPGIAGWHWALAAVALVGQVLTRPRS